MNIEEAGIILEVVVSFLLHNVRYFIFVVIQQEQKRKKICSEASWVVSVMHGNANEMYRTTQLDQVEKERLQREKHKKYDNATGAILSHDETWMSGGFEVEEVIPPAIALDIIRSVPLKTYKLRDDKKRDLGVSKDERRTRYL